MKKKKSKLREFMEKHGSIDFLKKEKNPKLGEDVLEGDANLLDTYGNGDVDEALKNIKDAKNKLAKRLGLG